MVSYLLDQDVDELPFALLAHLVPVLRRVLDKVLGYATEHNVPAGEYPILFGGQSLRIDSDAASQGVLDRVMADCRPDERYAMTAKNVVDLYSLPFEA